MVYESKGKSVQIYTCCVQMKSEGKCIAFSPRRVEFNTPIRPGYHTRDSIFIKARY
jgi:hypothetical protein